MARTMVNTLEDKKGENLILLDIHEVASFTDYFILANGTSDRMLEALSDALLETAKRAFQLNGRKEGQPMDGWVVIDFGDIVIHLFSPDQRDYYQLEKLWDRGKVLLRLQ